MAANSKPKAGRSSQPGTYASTVSSRNQLTLPQAVREAADIQAGANVVITPLPGGRIIIRQKSGSIASLAGVALKRSSNRMSTAGKTKLGTAKSKP